MVRKCIRLRVWHHSSKISEEEDFYLLEDLDAGISDFPGAHVILGRSSFIAAGMVSDQRPSLSPIFRGPKSQGKAVTIEDDA